MAVVVVVSNLVSCASLPDPGQKDGLLVGKFRIDTSEVAPLPADSSINGGRSWELLIRSQDSGAEYTIPSSQQDTSSWIVLKSGEYQILSLSTQKTWPRQNAAFQYNGNGTDFFQVESGKVCDLGIFTWFVSDSRKSYYRVTSRDLSTDLRFVDRLKTSAWKNREVADTRLYRYIDGDRFYYLKIQ